MEVPVSCHAGLLPRVSCPPSAVSCQPFANKNMPVRTLQFQSGAYYHIYNRGAARQSIFRAATNYLFVLRRMKQIAAAQQISIIAYCLMPNHYHWLVRQDGDAPAGLLPQHVFNSYTKAYNKLYKRSGTLFEARYKAKHVDSDAYLLHLCRYIHANPVKDSIVADVAEWPYSNYHEWLEQRNGKLVDQTFVAANFPSRSAYADFVHDYVKYRQLPDTVAKHIAEVEQ